MSRIRYTHRRYQRNFIALIEKWKSVVDTGKSFRALLTDFSKAFDCLPHELLLAKLNVYDLGLSALELIRSYLFNRQQRKKINASFSSWKEILFGVPQGTIFGPLLFNIFTCNQFTILENIDFASFAVDNTPFAPDVYLKFIYLVYLNSFQITK